MDAVVPRRAQGDRGGDGAGAPQLCDHGEPAGPHGVPRRVWYFFCGDVRDAGLRQGLALASTRPRGLHRGLPFSDRPSAPPHCLLLAAAAGSSMCTGNTRNAPKHAV
eukprot:787787-Pelagomonas_calceolata.AAC.1